MSAWDVLGLPGPIAGSANLRIRVDGDAAGWGIVATLTAAFPAATQWRMPPETTAFEEELLELLWRT